MNAMEQAWVTEHQGFAYISRNQFMGWQRVSVMDDFGELQDMGWNGFSVYCNQEH